MGCPRSPRHQSRALRGIQHTGTHFKCAINSSWVTRGCFITAPYFSVSDLLSSFRSFFHLHSRSRMDPTSPAAAEAIKNKKRENCSGSFIGGKIRGRAKAALTTVFGDGWERISCTDPAIPDPSFGILGSLGWERGVQSTLRAARVKNLGWKNFQKGGAASPIPIFGPGKCRERQFQGYSG